MPIMDIFRTMMGNNPAATPNPNVNPAAQNPALQQPNAVQLPNQQAAANPNADPANPNFGQPAEKLEKSPLEDFSKLWTIDPKVDGQPQASLGDFAFSVDQAAIKKATQGI